MKDRTFPAWLVGVIVAGIALRLALLRAAGFPDDVAAFENWALALGAHGTAGFYGDTSGRLYPAVDYPPGYVYVLWFIGSVYQGFCHCTDHGLALKVLEKLPAVLADFGVAFAAFAVAGKITTRRNAFITLAALLLLPPLWLISAYWGQVDSVAVLALVLTLWALVARRPALMWIGFAVTILIKPQAAPIAPLLLVWELRAVGLTAALPVGVACGAALAYLSTLPFTSDHRLGASGRWLLERYIVGVEKYPFNSTGGFTLYGVVGNFYQSDAQRFLGLSLHTWGLALFLTLLAAVTVTLWRTIPNSSTNARTLAAVYVVLAGFFVLSTRMHERYLMPALVVGFIVAFVDRRYALATLAFACTFTVNCAFILRGFYGGSHHPITTVVAHALSGVNVAAFVLIAATFFAVRTPSTIPLQYARRPPDTPEPVLDG